MSRELLVAGGGIGGLAAAVAARRAGWEARVFEQAAAFSEVGAGIQLGPNVTRILREWGLLQGELGRQACAPRRLRVRDAVDGRELARLELAGFDQRYGAPYLTAHRADLQAALLAAAQAAEVRLHRQRKVVGVEQQADAVRLRTEGGPEVEGEGLVGADGLWSTLRCAVVDRQPPRPTGHLAYRGLVRGTGSDEVSVWLGPDLHLVTYPVRGGEWLNVVCVVAGTAGGDPQAWDRAAVAANLHAAAGAVGAAARQVLDSVADWRLWALHDRPPVAAAEEIAKGRVALLGDAAHPMRPYLAQGAGMAIEDARALQQVLAATDERVLDLSTAFRRYALNRWQRVARVQRRSLRNGTIFHASGAMRWGRNSALRALGARLLDQPWLYGAS